MDLVDPDIDRYLGRWASMDDPVVAEMEALAGERGFPIVGPQVGRLLLALARSIGARRILELGSGFGYSAWWFATATGPEGRVILTEGSSDNAVRARDFLDRAGLGERVEIRVGDALELALEYHGPFDIVFNDIDKQDYPRALPVALERLRPGGLFITDNMLWQGRVLDEDGADEATRGVLDLTRALYAEPDLDTTILPIRDGVSVSVLRG
ncbi:MAG: methyltransferase domain-containing protein [Acidobacteria bacterium]|nr:methyltransferase domain-containing protein [Acidobacteriota bacterium]NIM63480.1 methyltransferase domain-containing protein [Acidobacteriota bacterium]NIO60908.1 methyltransferase domain-containing protein [Acidobacteriota bacterium]NIQ31100.1 methyltransferase domain-containing protein [Acidobacteriota bacterium]NIQ87369.1 methyltransferase domain-containing protein [Acidobacteriota bacterium]